MNGYVYVMFNPAFPHLVKVGRTTRSTNERAEELYSTGTPGKFIVAYDVLVDDCVEVEAIVHRELEKYRYSQNREFFECGLNDAIKCLERTSRGRHVSAIDKQAADPKVEFYLYCANISDGRELKHWHDKHDRLRLIHRIGVTSSDTEQEWGYFYSRLSEELVNYYNSFDRTTYNKLHFKIVDIFHIGALRSSCRKQLEEAIEKVLSEDPSYQDRMVFDSQTLLGQYPESVASIKNSFWNFKIAINQLSEDLMNQEFKRSLVKAEEGRLAHINKMKGNF